MGPDSRLQHERVIGEVRTNREGDFVGPVKHVGSVVVVMDTGRGGVAFESLACGSAFRKDGRLFLKSHDPDADRSVEPTGAVFLGMATGLKLEQGASIGDTWDFSPQEVVYPVDVEIRVVS